MCNSGLDLAGCKDHCFFSLSTDYAAWANSLIDEDGLARKVGRQMANFSLDRSLSHLGFVVSIAQHADRLDRDQTFGNRFVQKRQQTLNLFGVIHQLNYD